MLMNFVLPPSVDFLLMWQGKIYYHVSKSALSHSPKKKIFFLYHLSKKSTEGGKTKLVNIARRHSQIFFLLG
jgi:hypothetical protein